MTPEQAERAAAICHAIKVYAEMVMQDLAELKAMDEREIAEIEAAKQEQI